MADLLSPFAGDRSLEIASILINSFGSLSNAVGASRERLQAAFGDDDQDVFLMIQGARNLIEASQLDCVASSPVSTLDPRLHRYLRLRFQSCTYECIHVVFVGEGDKYLCDERIAWGTNCAVELNLRPFFRRAFDIGATAYVLAHNHPSGSVEPSRNDIESNDRLAAIGDALDLRLMDHLILTQSQVYSLRQRRIVA